MGFLPFPPRILPLFSHVLSYDRKQSCENEDFPEFFQ